MSKKLKISNTEKKNTTEDTKWNMYYCQECEHQCRLHLRMCSYNTLEITCPFTSIHMPTITFQKGGDKK